MTNMMFHQDLAMKAEALKQVHKNVGLVASEMNPFVDEWVNPW